LLSAEGKFLADGSEKTNVPLRRRYGFLPLGDHSLLMLNAIITLILVLHASEKGGFSKGHQRTHKIFAHVYVIGKVLFL
jgi:hypothetical protein